MMCTERKPIYPTQLSLSDVLDDAWEMLFGMFFSLIANVKDTELKWLQIIVLRKILGTNSALPGSD